MKKNTKKIIGLSLATLFCGTTAAVLPLVKQEVKAATPTNVFEIAEGASIRIVDPVGIRFIVKMSEDVKNEMVGKNFGFVISREDQFDNFEADNQTPNYLEMQNKTTTEVAITSENLSEYIYQGEEEYAGYWCANIVINMNEENGDTEELFTERAYSAVAYYENADETNRVYSTNRQERSIQEVASKLYLSNDSDWTNVNETYQYIGTETTPMLVAQSGKNSYNNLLDQCDKGEVEYNFELTENIIAETDLSNGDTTNFKGDINKKEYTVSSPEGYILDGTSATDIRLVGSYDGCETAVEFVEDVKYDSESNGSYKLTVKQSDMTIDEQRRIAVKYDAGYRKAYYEKLAALSNEYDYIAIRFMYETFESKMLNESGSETAGTVRFDYSEDRVPMHMYYNQLIQGGTAENNYTTWTFFNASITSNVPNGAWAEFVWDIDNFVKKFDSGELFTIVINNKNSIDLTMYIDNIYAVKGEAINDTTSYVDKGYSLENSENISQSLTYNGEVVENVTTLQNSGVYVQKAVERNYYGTIDNTFYVGRDVVSYNAANFGARHVVNSTSVGTDYSATMQDGKVVVSSNGAGKIAGVSVTTYKINMFADKAYYQALKDNGYEYLTYEYTLSYSGTAPGAIYRYAFVTGDYKHTNELAYGTIAFPYSVYEKTDAAFDAAKVQKSDKDTTNKPFISTWSPDTWNGKTFVVSIPMQTILNNYADQIRILAFYFNAKAETMDYSVTFGRIEATTNACVFDD